MNVRSLPRTRHVGIASPASGDPTLVGTKKAAGYLIGEMLLEFAGELSDFVREIKKIVTPDEIRAYFENLTHVGPAGHVMTDEQYKVLRDAGAIDTNVVRGAEDVIIVARIREMLLEDSAN